MQVEQHKRIIERAHQLSPETLPETIVDRTRERQKLLQCLIPAEHGLAPTCAWFYGPPGTGKTALARSIAQERFAGHNRVSAYVNCWERPTLYSTLQVLCEQLRILRADAQDTNVKLARLKQTLNTRPALLILDEIDRLMPKECDSILYQLLRLPRVGLFCISGDSRAFAAIDSRIRSRLAPVLVHLTKYNRSQLSAILEVRARSALAVGTYTQQTLNCIAEIADGDARRAICVLLNAAITAEQQNAQKISVRHVLHDMSKWKRLIESARVQSLSQHQMLIHQLVKKHRSVSARTLRQLYELECHKKSLTPVARRTFVKYIAILIRTDLIKSQGHNCGGSGRILTTIS
jgi:cell division control protein 6